MGAVNGRITSVKKQSPKEVNEDTSIPKQR